MPTPPSEFRYPCEQCGASLSFSPGEQSLKCPYCGHVQKIGPGAARAPARQSQDGAEGDRELLRDPATGRALQWDAGHKTPLLTEQPLQKGLALDAASDLAQDIRMLSCPNCGAKFELGTGTHASECPFCATPVVTDTGATRQIKPQGVLPFVVTEDQARAALEDWLGRLWFAPSGLVKYARKGRKMAGVYSPFWTFDADTASDYAGARGDWYYETRYVTQVVDGKSRRVAQQVRKTRWTTVRGQVSRSFNDVLVLASSALPRRITDALTPWDLSHLRPYNPQYLQGFGAEGYTIPLASGHEIARQEMEAVIAMDIRRDIGGDEQRISQARTAYSAETFKHVLLPVWSAAYKYNGKSYRFVVNGQSGRVQGERPWSMWKIGAAILAALVALAIMLFVAQQSGYVEFSANGFSSDQDYIIQGY
ncbi:zinc ribbon domain-containing protein [Paracoccus aerodenitrificans]|uniref:zinc ribbon domain-containing protein n=1 Tax=Paracoccus aerodenitrificans TaxID=3017781 RepID=UPI0022F0ECDD|nr:zinc ribbon domain-containing protein [Paracoccus aerodenitrificans]WBU65098.1 zinc ribbon domain-containing protein [Paracoccus aerodenitrificans]